MNSRPCSKSLQASATRCRTPSRSSVPPIKSSPRRLSARGSILVAHDLFGKPAATFADHAPDFRCRGEGDHLTSRPDAKRWKTRSWGSGAAVRHKEKNPPSAQYQCHPDVLLGEEPGGIAMGMFQPGPDQRE